MLDMVEEGKHAFARMNCRHVDVPTEGGLTAPPAPEAHEPAARSLWAHANCQNLEDKFDASEWSLQVENARKKATSTLFGCTRDIVDQVLLNLRELMNESILRDPDLWPVAKTFFQGVLDHFWDDCQHEIQRKAAIAALRKAGSFDFGAAASEEGPRLEGRLGSLWCRVRAFVLYHFLPFDKSFFGKSKDPVYVAILVIAMLPIHGLRVAIFTVILLFLVLPNHLTGWEHPDEFQLLNFILMCKGTQFFSQGIGLMFLGSMHYYRCNTWYKDDIRACIETQGPGSGNLFGQVVDYFGSILLVWAAFSLLKLWSRGKRMCEQGPDAPYEFPEQKNPGGRMWPLLFYDIKCFLASLLLLVVLSLCTLPPGRWPSSPQFGANLYWCRVLYSAASLPFSFFTIPFFQLVLTHTTRTGFNVNGACVLADFPVKRRKPKEWFQRLFHLKRGRTTFALYPSLSLRQTKDALYKKRRAFLAKSAAATASQSRLFPLGVPSAATVDSLSEDLLPPVGGDDGTGSQHTLGSLEPEPYAQAVYKSVVEKPGLLPPAAPSRRCKAVPSANPGIRLQWMWTDPGIFGRGPRFWSFAKAPHEVAAQLESRGKYRPVQIREVASRSPKSFGALTEFPDTHEAVQWIRNKYAVRL